MTGSFRAPRAPCSPNGAALLPLERRSANLLAPLPKAGTWLVSASEDAQPARLSGSGAIQTEVAVIVKLRRRKQQPASLA